VFSTFENFIPLQRALEGAGVSVTSAELRRIPNNTVAVTDEQAEDIIKLIDKIEEDDDVQNVYHNMNED
jgi:transcriptional/translational regulatory protein YebC/TACO1